MEIRHPIQSSNFTYTHILRMRQQNHWPRVTVGAHGTIKITSNSKAVGAEHELNFAPMGYWRLHLKEPFWCRTENIRQTNNIYLQSQKRSENENGNYGNNRNETRTWFLLRRRIKTSRNRSKFILPLIEILKFDWLRQINFAALLCFLINLIFSPPRDLQTTYYFSIYRYDNMFLYFEKSRNR